MKIIINIILILTSGMVLAQDQIRLFYRPFRGQTELNQSLAHSLKQTTLRYLASLPGHELVLNSSAPPEQSLVPALAVEGAIIKQGQTYSFTLSLLDLKKKTLVSTIKKDQIREEDLIRLILGGLKALFIPIKKSEKSRNKKTNAKINTINERSIVTGVNSQKTIDFKERIRLLQSQADQAADQAAENKQAISSKENSVASKKKNSVVEGQSFGIQQTIQTELKSPKKSSRLAIPKEYTVGTTFENRRILSESLIRTFSDISFLHLSMDAKFWQSPTRAWSLDAGVDYVKAIKAEVPTPNLLGLDLGARFKHLENAFALTLKKEDLVFYNISDPGSGLEAGTIEANWLQLLAEFKPRIFKNNWTLKGHYSHLLSSQSSFETLKSVDQMKGNTWGVELGLPYIVYGLKFRIMYKKTTLSAQGDQPFKLQDTRLLAGAHYTF